MPRNARAAPAAGGRHWGLQAVVATGLVTVVVAFAGSLAALAVHEFARMADDMAQAVLGQQAREAADRFSRRVADAQRVAEAVARDDPWAQPAAHAALEHTARSAMAADRSLVSIRVLRDGGAWWHAVALAGGDGPAGQEASSRPVPLAMAGTDADGGLASTRLVDSDGRALPADQARLVEAVAQDDDVLQRWRAATRAQGGAAVSPAHALRQDRGAGLTVAHAPPGGAVAAWVVVALGGLSEELARMAARPELALALTDPSGVVAAWGGGPAAGPPSALLAPWGGAGTAASASVDLQLAGSPGWRVQAYAPRTAFEAAARAARDRMLALAAGLCLLALGLALWCARRVAGTLAQLRDGARRIQKMDFGDTVPISSPLREIAELSQVQMAARAALRHGTEALRSSQQRLQLLIEAGLRMGRERDHQALMQQILASAREVAHCDAVTLYTMTDHGALRFALRTREDPLPLTEIPLYDGEGRANTQFVSVFAALRNEAVVIDDVYADTRFDLSGTRSFDAQTGYRTVSMLALPLAPRDGQVVGVLQLMNATDPATGRIVGFDAETRKLAAALAAQAAVSLDNHRLVRAHEDMVDAMVRLLAGAIDAKSPDTGGHCERVPELAFMLAEEAGRSTRGALADFAFTTPQQWREFRIGAWLHDCGKITTPEYVMDKATKLETIHDRIHEVRTRFEVLWRDAEIDYLQALRDGADAAGAQARRDARRAALQADFAFVAECNLGSESMDDSHVERLRAIGAQSWWRHFDDRLGISHAARLAAQGLPSRPLPVLERLLDDKPEHIVARAPDSAPSAQLGFRVSAPEHLYHRGELHNLTVRRGTLTPEERFKINEHIMQTIAMLEAIPFPPELRRVPEYAGTHHERLDGRGYPRGLTGAALSVPARIMAVADIFEALTAADRPYKAPKKLSEAVELLWRFKKNGHIDGDVFDLLLESGVYLRYAQRFLAPECIDAVDVRPYLGRQEALPARGDAATAAPAG